jgi:hypothetical protein
MDLPIGARASSMSAHVTRERVVKFPKSAATSQQGLAALNAMRLQQADRSLDISVDI